MSDRLFLYSIVGFGFGCYLFIMGFRWLAQKRLIENTPTSKIRSIAMGVVEIYGAVLFFSSEVLKSPFSAKDCVYYNYRIEEFKSSGKRSRWVTVKQGHDCSRFYLKDDTGTVLIDPKGAQVDVPADNTFNSGIGQNPPKKAAEFLKSCNISYTGLLGFNKKMRYTECYIAPKDKLYVMGTAGDNPFVKEATSKKGVLDVMIQKGNNIYYIFDKHEKDIISGLRWKMIGGVFGGGALIAACLSVIFIYLGWT